MNLIRGIINVLSTLVIVIGGFCLVLFAFGIKPFVVISGSMEPSIKTGSVSFINTRTDYSEIKENDVIAFKMADGTLVTHRVIEITSEGFETKGDANSVSDDIKTTSVNYFGKNIFSVPKIGFIVKVFQSPKGKIVCGTCVLLLFAAGLLLGDNKKEV